MNVQVSKRERGIALIIVTFALLLLSVIGLGMMYSSNMETAINSNYKDKQEALYAAIAGLQEARQRIIYPYTINPSNNSVAPPSQLPTLTAQNIVYFVANATTVQPWNASNAYLDTELCQENLLAALNISGTTGVPCTVGAPSGSYIAYDDSLSSSSPWNLQNPLDLKWVRIQLKGNNNTPYPVNGNASDGSQTCWDGVQQMSSPYGSSAGCAPTGGVTAIINVNSGAGYTATGPTVTISGGGGTGATATPNMVQQQTGVVTSITVGTGGSGYTTAPTVTVAAGLTSTATATATLGNPVTTTSGGSVVSVTMSTGGANYTSAPTVTFGGPGSGATAIAVLATAGTVNGTGWVASVNVTSGGSTGYATAPTVTFSGGRTGNGTDATGTANLNISGGGSISSTTLTIDPSYTGHQCFTGSSDVNLTLTGGTVASGGSAATTNVALIAGATKSCVHSVSIVTPPTNCGTAFSSQTTQNNITFVTTPSSGSADAYGSMTVGSGANKKNVVPASWVLTDPGAGYSSGTGTFSSTLTMRSGFSWNGGGSCTNVNMTATLGYPISQFTLTVSGGDYTVAPTGATISGGVLATEPTVSAPSFTLLYPLITGTGGVTLTSQGSGYVSAPTVSFSGSGGAIATATVTDPGTKTVYTVASVTITNGGNGYTSAPTVSFSGGAGTGAAGTATVAATTNTTTYSVTGFTVVTGGSGYATVPAVTITGGGGSGATGTAVLTTENAGTYMVAGYTITNQGSGYTGIPTVTLSGGGGSGASGTATVSGGTKYGTVWLLTAFAQTKTGARSMVQMEVANPVATTGFALGGALTLDGPNPTMDAMPNSNPFHISGYDTASCGNPEPPHPAIDGYDNPNANPPTNSVTDIVNSLPKPDHYIGSGGTPSVQNGYAGLGPTMTTPTGLKSVITAVSNAPGAQNYGSLTGENPTSNFNPANTTISSITYVDGDLSLGPVTGNGILVVTGTLRFTGNFGWNGLILVIGDGAVDFSGGGNGQINGSLFVANIWDGYATKNLDSSLGSPFFHWNGGGGNGIYYDHCLADNLMSAVPMSILPNTSPSKTLSFRILPY